MDYLGLKLLIEIYNRSLKGYRDFIIQPMRRFSIKIITLCILSVLILESICFQPDQMSYDLLERLKVQQDYIHHFLFLNKIQFQKLDQLYGPQLQQLSKDRDIKFYSVDCNNLQMKQCETKDEVPILLLFNRIFIQFNGGKSQSQFVEIYDWILMRVGMSPVPIQNKSQLLKQLQKAREMFCYCHANNQEKALFYSLSKSLIITNYCLLDNKTMCQEIGLKPGNLTLFKNATLQHRVEFQYPNRYDMWEMFLKTNVINHVKKSGYLIKKRFSHEDKNIDTTIVICDLSYKCEKFWIQFQKWSQSLIHQHPQLDIAMTFLDQKQILLYNIYFSTALNNTSLPALLNVKIQSKNSKAGWFRRYQLHPQKVDEDEILNFIKNIKNGKIHQIQLSGPIPPKNGFTGKNAQKLIQKVVAQNLNQTIAASSKHYVLLLSTFGIGCKQCEQFYKDYKKAASFMSEQDITFGYMDVLKNQIRIENVQSIPQVLLFNKYFKEDPVVMRGRLSFDSLLRFLENNAMVNYSLQL